MLKIDDPVGAISVHGVCGAFGTWRRLFADPAFGGKRGSSTVAGQAFLAQSPGSPAVFLWASKTSLILFLVIKATWASVQR